MATFQVGQRVLAERAVIDGKPYYWTGTIIGEDDRGGYLVRNDTVAHVLIDAAHSADELTPLPFEKGPTV